MFNLKSILTQFGRGLDGFVGYNKKSWESCVVKCRSLILLEPLLLATFAELMGVYRRGLIRKAQAITEAVNRGLMPALSHSK